MLNQSSEGGKSEGGQKPKSQLTQRRREKVMMLMLMLMLTLMKASLA